MKLNVTLHFYVLHVYAWCFFVHIPCTLYTHYTHTMHMPCICHAYTLHTPCTYTCHAHTLQGLTAEEVLHGVRMAPEDVAALAACLPGITALLAAVRAQPKPKPKPQTQPQPQPQPQP